MDLLATTERKRALGGIVCALGASAVLGIAATAVPLFTFTRATGQCSFYTTHMACTDGDTDDISDFPCDLMKERMRATLVLNILADVLLSLAAIGLVVGTLQAQGAVQMTSMGLACLSWILLLTVWAMSVAWFNGSVIYCDVEYPSKLQGFTFGASPILVIIALCMTTIAIAVMVVLRQVVPWDVSKNYTGLPSSNILKEQADLRVQNEKRREYVEHLRGTLAAKVSN